MNEKHPGGGTGHRALGLIICNARMHRRIVERCFNGLGIHNSQHRLLMHLAQNGKTLSQKQIAKDFDISQASVAVMIKKLVQSGFIEKSGCDADNRRNEISITPTGMEIVSKSHVYFEEIEKVMFQGMSEEEMQSLLAGLTRLQQNLSEYEESLCAKDSPVKE